MGQIKNIKLHIVTDIKTNYQKQQSLQHHWYHPAQTTQPWRTFSMKQNLTKPTMNSVERCCRTKSTSEFNNVTDEKPSRHCKESKKSTTRRNWRKHSRRNSIVMEQ